MSTILPSQLEKRFIATSMYKRSKHYFDINKLNQIEVKQEQIRRKPYVETNVSSLDNKFEESFISAQARLNERLQTEVDKHQKRFFRDGDDQTQTSFTFQGRKGKTLDMNKMLSRQYFEKDGRQCKNQSHFCNFKQYQIPNNTIDFTKYTIPRVSKKGKNQINCNRCKSKQKMNEESNTDQLNADITGKIREKLIFDESLFKTVVDYKKYDKQKTQRQQKSSPERKYDQILTGQNMTRKKAKGSLLEFYHGMNKWTSAQMDNRLMRQNQYFIKVYNAKNQQKIDWAILKKKTDLIEKRRNQILKRKNIKDVKGEICDDLYFRRNPLP